MKNFKKRKKLTNVDLNFSNLFKRALLFTLLFFATSLVIILIMSCIFYNTADPTSKIGIVSLCALYFSAFLCGLALSRINRQFYLLGGAILGTMIFTFTLLLSLLFSKDGLMATSIGWRLLAPVFCIIGSLAGIHRENPQKRRKHR